MLALCITLLLPYISRSGAAAFQRSGAPQSCRRDVVSSTTPSMKQMSRIQTSDECHPSRRTCVQSALGCGAFLLLAPLPSNAAIFGGKDRRQLEYCLVNVLRVTYWAESTVQELKATQDEDRRKKIYLEARLGAKALVTGKVGGGATNRVYQLSTLQFRGCLEDIAFYSKSRQVADMTQDLLEAIAAIVEFDGLETTTDPSPRSSLTLSMYNPQKAAYVQRLLSERVIPLCKQIFNLFDPGVRQRCEMYVASTYSNEVPKRQDVASTTSTIEES